MTAASAMFAGSPKFGACRVPPPAQPNDTGSSDIPMTVITDAGDDGREEVAGAG